MKQKIAIETTTLPEGAILEVARVRDITEKKETLPRTVLSAKNDRATIEMTVAHVAPHNLRAYLDLTVKEIDRQRTKLTRADSIKPAPSDKTPRDFADFVGQMWAYNMFIIR